MATSPQQLQDLIGQVLSDTYRFESLLGTGGMGAVYRASHLRIPKQAAIKVLRAEIAAMPTVFARFRREAEITSALNHPHIVQILDFDELPDGTHCLVMELLRGEDLAARLHRVRSLPFSEVCGLVRAVSSALSAAHSQLVVHRDLKPQNIFLARHEQGDQVLEIPKLVDFGISKIRHAREGTLQTIRQELLGTPNYMSPEQARGDNDQVDERTDQWALAAIAYECLTGRLAFPGDTVAAAMYQVLMVEPAGLATLGAVAPPAAVEAIRRALSKDREARFPSITEFAAAFSGHRISGQLETLSGSLRDQATVFEGPATIPSAAPVPSPPGRRLLLAGGIAAGVALLLGGGWLLTRRPPPAPQPGPAASANPPPAAAPLAAAPAAPDLGAPLAASTPAAASSGTHAAPGAAAMTRRPTKPPKGPAKPPKGPAKDKGLELIDPKL